MADNEINEKYADAVLAVWQELKELTEQERDIAIRKAQLRKSFNALFPLAFPGEKLDVNTLTLPDAIRLLMASTGRPLSALDIQTKLEDIGYDVSKFDQPLANIQTAMKRMLDSEELTRFTDDNKKVVPGPELKAPPDVTPALDSSEVENLLNQIELSEDEENK
jgi:hypothetical protein